MSDTEKAESDIRKNDVLKRKKYHVKPREDSLKEKSLTKVFNWTMNKMYNAKRNSK